MERILAGVDQVGRLQLDAFKWLSFNYGKKTIEDGHLDRYSTVLSQRECYRQLVASQTLACMMLIKQKLYSLRLSEEEVREIVKFFRLKNEDFLNKKR